ncbi:MAG: glycoside hydrolase family 31 protein [Anaerolineaceae bacterium]|nr:glycoside hydrolase family 31 protein [Anaerolineaceae bacterium]
MKNEFPLPTSAPQGVHCTQPTPPTLEFTASQGERFTVTALEEDIVRVTFTPEGAPRLGRTWLVLGKNGQMPEAGRDRNDLTGFSLPPVQVEQNDSCLALKTQRLRVEIQPQTLALRWSTAEGTLLAADVEKVPYVYAAAGDAVGHNLLSHPDEYYYGFGEISGRLNKAHSHILLKNIDNPGYSAKNGSPLYKLIPFYITYSPRTHQAFGFFYDNLATTTFDLNTHADGLPEHHRYAAQAGDIDYYFIYGPTMAEVIEKFTRLTGRMLLPPRWSLGYMGSTMNYTEAKDAQTQLAKFGRNCEHYQIPCNLFHLSSGYTLGEDGKRYVFHWNRSRVPDPQAMVDDFHAHGIRLAANIKPALLTTHPRFEEVRQLGAFIREPGTDQPQLFPFWGGIAAALDFTNPAAVAWWKKNAKEQLLDYGIDSTWNDNNEFEVQEGEARCLGFGEEFPVKYARPLQTLLMMRTSYAAQLEQHPNERPFLISRSGCAGMQRYVQTWSGDNFTSWQTLKYNIPMGLGLSLSGVPNTGHDVGGFAGPRPSPELFVRWVQNGIFHPRFTIHSWKILFGANEPWMFPSVFPIIRETIQFRYRLMPYLYNLLVEAAATGHPIIRPLVYSFPDDPHCLEESFDFMLGPSLLVASVVAPWVRHRQVYLPAGQDWVDFYTGARYSGGQTITAAAPLSHLPLFVTAGTMIPMGEVVHPRFHASDDVRKILVFPTAGTGAGSLDLHEDDGETLAYQRGETTCVQIHGEYSAASLKFSVELAPYEYSLPYSELEFILPPGETRRVEMTGLKKQWQDEAGQTHFTWAIPQRRH